MGLSALPAHVPVWHMCIGCLWRPEESVRMMYLQMVVSHCLGAGSQTQLLWTNCQCS